MIFLTQKKNEAKQNNRFICHFHTTVCASYNRCEVSFKATKLILIKMKKCLPHADWPVNWINKIDRADDSNVIWIDRFGLSSVQFGWVQLLILWRINHYHLVKIDISFSSIRFDRYLRHFIHWSGLLHFGVFHFFFSFISPPITVHEVCNWFSVICYCCVFSQCPPTTNENLMCEHFAKNFQSGC